MYLLDLYAVLPPNSAIILAVYEAAMNRYDYWVNEEIRMNLKHKILLVVMASLLGFAGLATAGKQGISFYAGLGATAIAPDSNVTSEFDPALGGNIFLGIEEDGWFLEYIGLATAKGGTNNAAIEYSVQGGFGSLGYRTLETKSGLYFLLSVGAATSDVTITQTALPDTTAAYSGNGVTVGIGMRLDKTERLELDYSMLRLSLDKNEVGASDFDAHMVTLRYIWGGNPYNPKF